MTVDKAFQELCLACRLGDIESVDKVLSTGVNVNDVDEFDYTPLYLASLCGHEPVVKLLLQRGAVCDTDKYEGARCIYGALTDSIRNLLISYDISKTVDTNLPFAAHFRSLFGGSDLLTEDVVLKLGDSLNQPSSPLSSNLSLRLHKFMLSARSPYFREKMSKEWRNKETITLPYNESTDAHTFHVALEYLYLVHDPRKFEQVDKKSLLEYARTIELSELVDGLEKYIHTMDTKERAKLVNEIQMKVFEGARRNLKSLVENEIIGQRLELAPDTTISEKQIKKFQNSDAYPDIILSIEDTREIEVLPEDRSDQKWITSFSYYPVHRSVLIRDEYFKVMFASDFSEAHEYQINETLDIVDRSIPIPVIPFRVASPEVAEVVIKFLYYDHADIPLELAVDVLYAGEILLNDRLKTMAAVTLTASKTPPPGYTFHDIMKAAWETRMDRLEHHVARVIAENLDHYLWSADFAAIVVESSERIDFRQETDTIEVIDDIRFYLAKKWKIDFDGLFPNETNERVEEQPGFESYQEDLDKIEDLLTRLDLEA